MISGRDSPRSVSSATREMRVLSTSEQRTLGSLVTAAVTSALERPRLERKATTASGLEASFRWETLFDAFRAWARVRPQVATR